MERTLDIPSIIEQGGIDALAIEAEFDRISDGGSFIPERISCFLGNIKKTCTPQVYSFYEGMAEAYSN